MPIGKIGRTAAAGKRIKQTTKNTVAGDGGAVIKPNGHGGYGPYSQSTNVIRT